METVLHEFKNMKQNSKYTGSLELELRFQDLNYDIFSTILSSLAKKYKWSIEKTVDYRSGDNIRQIEYKGNSRVPGNKYKRKEIISRTRVMNALLDYNLTLSVETDISEMSEKSNFIIRVKLRFRFTIDPLWQIHATVICNLSGDQQTIGSQVQSIVNKMFKVGEITPENLAAKLDLSKDSSDYKYEIEAELMDVSANITISDINNVANTIFMIIGNDKTENIQFQNEVYFIASYIEDNEERLAKFRKQYGIKNLAPAVIPLNKSLYKTIYPPVNYFVSDKADGIHAFVSIHDQKCHVIADKYYSFSNDSLNLSKKSITILDCELIYTLNPEDHSLQSDQKKSNIHGTSRGVITPLFKLLVFDAIIIDGKHIADKGFEIRQEYFQEGCKMVSAFGLKIAPKKFLQIVHSDPKHIEEQIRKVTDTIINKPDGEPNGGPNDESKNKKQEIKSISGTSNLKTDIATREYEIDGLIMVEPGNSYKQTNIYKHKSLKDNTIDFLSMRCPAGMNLPQRPNTEIYFLFNGITYDLFKKLGIQFCPGYHQIFENTTHSVPSKERISRHELESLPNLFPVQFCPSDSPLAYIYYHPVGKDLTDSVHASLHPVGGRMSTGAPDATRQDLGTLHEKIIELRCKGPCNAAGGIDQYVDWELVKIRGDRLIELANKRYFGNYFEVAEMTWINYIDPFPIEQIWNGPVGGYFSEEKSGIYFAQTAFTSYVKSKRIEYYTKYKLVIDLAGGKGQDLGRYFTNKIQEVIIIDRDKTALAELERRKYDIIKGLTRRHGKQESIETVLRAMWADLNTNFKDIIARLHRNFPETREKANAVVSNLAIHYCMNNMEELHNYSALVQLLTNNIFSVICMFGDRVNTLFNENKTDVNEEWSSYQDGRKKYSLRKLYKGNELTKIGQKIGVMLPFSGGEHYEENLVNIDTLSSEFQTRGFKIKAVISFDKYFNDFKRDNAKVYSMLTKEDFKYLSLYGEIIFEKVS